MNLSSKIFLFIFIIWFVLALSRPVFAIDASSGHLVDEHGYRYIQINESKSDIKIDGRLTEDDWQKSTFQAQFLQREPNYGQSTSEETAVAVLKNKEYLYVGIKCYDSSTSKIIANEMRRDARVDDDDFFEIILDTFHDGRTGYYFIINPNGVKRDATIGDEGKSYNPNWDGIWDCATKITEKGWFAEIAIPWKTLRFDPADKSLWGINFARMIRRKNEHVFWQLVPLDAGHWGLFRLSRAGDLHGLSNIQSSGNLDFLPFILGGIARDEEISSSYSNVKEIGLDGTFALTSNLNLKLSLNTDFAQVEADQEMVNLTRFSLYFPEKRGFFLDGAEIFNFGSARMGRRRMSKTNLNLFYSRRIGIIEEHQQPIVGGAKLLGKTGSYQVGFLNMQTEAIEAIEDEKNVQYPGANYSVFRVRKDLFQRSSIGIMFLNKHHNQSRYYNRSAGIDAIFPLTDIFTISGNIAATTDPSIPSIGIMKKNLAGALSIDYNSDLWQFKLSHLSIQENFNAEMGYIRRSNIRTTSSEIEYSPRPKNWTSVRQLSYEIQYDYMTDQMNRLLESEIDASFMIEFQNSSRFLLGFDRETEFIDEDWEVRENILVPIHTYTNYGSYIWAMTDESKDYSGDVFLKYGKYFEGNRLYINPAIILKNFRKFRTDIDFAYNHINLPAGSFDIRTIGCRLYYFLSTSLYLKAYLQWNDDRKDNEGDRIALSNILFRWIYQPGSDVYLVYNEGWKLGPIGNRNFNRTLLVKFTYFLRT